MTMWPYPNWPYAPIRTDGMGPGMMNSGMMNPGMTSMGPDHSQHMMAMMKAMKETLDRVERRLIAMEKMMSKE